VARWGTGGEGRNYENDRSESGGSLWHTYTMPLRWPMVWNHRPRCWPAISHNHHDTHRPTSEASICKSRRMKLYPTRAAKGANLTPSRLHPRSSTSMPALFWVVCSKTCAECVNNDSIYVIIVGNVYAPTTRPLSSHTTSPGFSPR
jgi:hypothetical protein